MSENSKTIMYAAAMTLVVAIALAGLTGVLKPIQKVEVDKDKKVSILKAVEFNEFMAADPEKEYKKRIEEVVFNSDGEVLQGEKAFDIRLNKEYKKPVKDRKYPLYIYTTDSKEKKYIMPLVGMGLWDEINGFLALQDNFRVIDGTSFGHVGETPGLGAEITTDWFQGQFKGKNICNATGNYEFKVFKGMGNTLDENSVDGITGATITCDGLADMMEKCYAAYSTYFTKADRNVGSADANKSIVSKRISELSDKLFTNNNLVRFVGNSSIIKGSSNDAVEALANFLNQNPDKRVEIAVDDTKANYNLANRRAESVYAYAIQQGANPKQLNFVAKSKAKNGVVNFKIIK